MIWVSIVEVTRWTRIRLQIDKTDRRMDGLGETATLLHPITVINNN